jgi:hypothetical protein
LGVIGASAWMLSAVDDADFEELQDSDIAIAVPDPGMNNRCIINNKRFCP